MAHKDELKAHRNRLRRYFKCDECRAVIIGEELLDKYDDRCPLCDGEKIIETT